MTKHYANFCGFWDALKNKFKKQRLQPMLISTYRRPPSDYGKPEEMIKPTRLTIWCNGRKS